VNWTRIAYNSDPAEAFGNFDGLDLNAPDPVLGREAPMSLGRLQEGAPAAPANDEIAQLREEIRRMVVEELRHALRKP
jgi:hypothetical protein